MRTSDKPQTQVARELGVSVASLRSWRNQLLKDGGTDIQEGESTVSPKELWDENRRLRQEVHYLKRQREILKKAASILAEDPRPGMP